MQGTGILINDCFKRTSEIVLVLKSNPYSTKMKKILLNYLPPSDVYTPSASLSILKSFMVSNGFDTEVKYWNFLFAEVFPLEDNDETEAVILPFLSIINDQYNNSIGNNRAISLLQKLLPARGAKGNKYYINLLQGLKSQIYDIIHRELKKIDFSETLLFGISSKFHQWIPGMILSEEIKKISEGKIMQSFSKIIPSGKKEKIVVFNTNFWEREEIVKMEGKEDIVVFENKKLLKTQNYKGDTYFYVKIPPFGYKVLDFKKGKSKEKVINKKKQLENFKFENENYVIKTEGNQLKIKAKFLKYPVFEERNFGEILFREDRGDLWKENFFGIIMGSKYESERIKEIRQGDVLTSFLIEGEVEKGKEGFLHGDFWDGFESLRWKKEFIFPEKERRFILKVKIEWRGRNTKVMLCFPTKIDPLKGKAIYEIPFGSIERLPYYEVDFKWSKKIKKFGQYVYSTSKGDWPAVNWVDYSDDKIGVGVANKGIPAYQLKGGKIFISLLRSPTAKSSAFTPDVGSYENGSHIYEFSILPHKGGEIEDVIKMGYNLNTADFYRFCSCN